MPPSPLATLVGQIETDALGAWDELAELMTAELREGTLKEMHKRFVEHQRNMRKQLRDPAAASFRTDLGKTGQGVAGIVQRINVLRTALKPVWAGENAADGSLGAMPIEDIEKLEFRRTELMEALGKLADAAMQLRRALENPPTTSAGPADGGDDNRDVG